MKKFLLMRARWSLPLSRSGTPSPSECTPAPPSNYHSGVYDDPHCRNGQLNHAILVVGYDKSGSEPFWIVKNSWGGSWGDHGYINMEMGVNECGMKADPC